MVSIKLTKEEYELLKSPEMQKYYIFKKSKASHQQCLNAALTELSWGKFMQPNHIDKTRFPYPLLKEAHGGFDYTRFAVMIDIKSTTINVKYVAKYFQCSIDAGQIDQKCEIYVFIFVNIETLTCIIAGYILKKDFIKKARIINPGELLGNKKPAVRKSYTVEVQDLILIESPRNFSIEMKALSKKLGYYKKWKENHDLHLNLTKMKSKTMHAIDYDDEDDEE
jgi:hypothetical protein